MTKQEEIRKGIKESIGWAMTEPRYDRSIDIDVVKAVVERATEMVYNKLHKQGCVLKVDRELPERMFIEGYGYLQEHSAQALLDKAGYTATEPLVDRQIVDVSALGGEGISPGRGAPRKEGNMSTPEEKKQAWEEYCAEALRAGEEYLAKKTQAVQSRVEVVAKLDQAEKEYETRMEAAIKKYATKVFGSFFS